MAVSKYIKKWALKMQFLHAQCGSASGFQIQLKKWKNFVGSGKAYEKHNQKLCRIQICDEHWYKDHV